MFGVPRHTKKTVAFFCMLFFEVLLFTDTASVVNGKTSKKSMQKNAAFFLVCQDPYLLCFNGNENHVLIRDVRDVNARLLRMPRKACAKL